MAWWRVRGGTASQSGRAVKGVGTASLFPGKTRQLRTRMTDYERRAGCERERREPKTLRRGFRDVPAREDARWRRWAVRAEDCAAQPGLTPGISGERSESAACRG
jgi:hypothetical protein